MVNNGHKPKKISWQCITGPRSDQKYRSLLNSIDEFITFQPPGFSSYKSKSYALVYIGVSRTTDGRLLRHFNDYGKRIQKHGKKVVDNPLNMYNDKGVRYPSEYIIAYTTNPKAPKEKQLEEIGQLEKDTIRDFRRKYGDYIYNIAPGGEGITGKPPYFLYVYGQKTFDLF